MQPLIKAHCTMHSLKQEDLLKEVKWILHKPLPLTTTKCFMLLLRLLKLIRHKNSHPFCSSNITRTHTKALNHPWTIFHHPSTRFSISHQNCITTMTQLERKKKKKLARTEEHHPEMVRQITHVMTQNG